LIQIVAVKILYAARYSLSPTENYDAYLIFLKMIPPQTGLLEESLLISLVLPLSEKLISKPFENRFVIPNHTSPIQEFKSDLLKVTALSRNWPCNMAL
jgi:hypothetical protein